MKATFDNKKVFDFFVRKFYGGSVGTIIKGNYSSFHFGAINADGGMPSENTFYSIGSVTKIFTSVLVLLAQEENLLSINQPVIDFFPNIKGIKRDICIKNLLNHTSGMKLIYTKEFYLEFYFNYSSAIPKYHFEFVERDLGNFSYNNLNYHLLAAILEKLYKQSYHALVIEKIISKHSLSVLPDNVLREQLALPFYDVNNSYIEFNPLYYQFCEAAGCMFSNVSSVAYFIKLLFVEEAIINRSSIEQMKIFLPNGYGLGLISFRNQNADFVGHFGDTIGYTTAAFICEQTGNIFAVMLNNTNRTALDEILYKQGLLSLMASA